MPQRSDQGICLSERDLKAAHAGTHQLAHLDVGTGIVGMVRIGIGVEHEVAGVG
ncbi:hypothetical protein [Pseudomonas putida]|uniref:hypothetical protein n=1 Tax=Pseudomonas putida TaxID=303 RepID=UPI001869D404|nr:hypothetical protein [Pseudomonas putida]